MATTKAKNKPVTNATLMTRLVEMLANGELNRMSDPNMKDTEGLVGQKAVARTDLTPTGSVFLKGEWWDAESLDGDISKGESVIVESLEGLNLRVRRKVGGS